MRFEPAIVLSLVLGALAPAASAQTATATPAEAFLYAVEKVCAPNAMGKLPLNAPTPALDALKVMLVDGGTDPDVRGAFHDMPVTVDYGAVSSATGQIVIAADEAGSCRVAAIHVSSGDVAAIRAAMRAQAGDWNPISNDAAAGQTTYSGTVDGESVMVQVTVPPAGSHWGAAGIMITVMNPAAPG